MFLFRVRKIKREKPWTAEDGRGMGVDNGKPLGRAPKPVALDDTAMHIDGDTVISSEPVAAPVASEAPAAAAGAAKKGKKKKAPVVDAEMVF